MKINIKKKSLIKKFKKKINSYPKNTLIILSVLAILIFIFIVLLIANTLKIQELEELIPTFKNSITGFAGFIEDTDTEFNSGVFNNTNVTGTGASANVTLHKQNFLEILTDLGLTENLVLVLDAGANNSYNGTSQVWSDLSNNDSNFTRGTSKVATTDDPTFNGNPGELSNNEFWSFDGGDIFAYDGSPNKAWADHLHKDGANFTILYLLNLSTIADDHVIMGERNDAGGTGIRLNIFGSGTSRINIYDGASTALEVTTGDSITDETWHLWALSLDETAAAGGSFFYSDGSYLQVGGADTFNGAYSSPSSGTAQNPLRIGGNAGSGSPNKLLAGDEIMGVIIWNDSLTKTELDNVWNRIKYRFQGTTYAAAGNFTSQTLDSGANANWTNISFNSIPNTPGVNATFFDGTNDALEIASLTGAADTKLGLVSFWVKFDGEDGNIQVPLSGSVSGAQMLVERTTDNEWHVEQNDNPATTGVLRMWSNGIYTVSDGWHHVMMSWNLNTLTGHMYINDIDDLDTGTDVYADTAGAASGTWDIGQQYTGSNKLNGSLAEFYYTQEYLNLSIESNRRKLIDSNGLPVDLGSNAASVTGTQPLVYFSGNLPSFLTNKGSGGAFTETGELENSTSSPSDRLNITIRTRTSNNGTTWGSWSSPYNADFDGTSNVVFVNKTLDLTPASTTVTFTDHAIGEAADNRKVVVAAYAGGSATQGISYVTIGGVNATERIEKVISVGGGVNEQTIAFYDLDVTSGTNATIVVGLARSAGRVTIAVWAVYGAGSTPYDTQSDDAAASSDDPSISMNVPSNGVLIAATGDSGGSGSTHTWAGVTEDHDDIVEINTAISGGSANFTAKQTGLTVAPTYSDVLSAGVLVGISWGPSYKTSGNQTVKGTSQARYIQYMADFSTENMVFTPKLQDVSLYFIVLPDACSCPISGNFVIDNSNNCALNLNTVCNLGTGALYMIDGTLTISNGTTLKAQGCFIKDGQDVYIEEGGGLICTG